MSTIAKILDNNTIEVLDLSQFDCYSIMHSGQIFRYFEREGGGWSLVVGKNFADIEVLSDKVIIRCNDADFFWNYFDLDTDYNQIKKELLDFNGIRPSIEAGGGIRILRSEFNEMVISFIISANNNIKRFTKTLNGLSERFGEKLPNGLYSFPTLQKLSRATLEDFRALGCGYRAAYLVKAVEQLKKIDVNELAELSNDLLDKKLQTICGVGAKVCACVKLFCGRLHRVECCPIDTWIDKALGVLSEKDKEALLNHRYAGIAQQYVFYYLQHLGESLN